MPERIIRPGIITSDRVCALTWGAEVFYRRLMSVADDYGRYDGRPAILRASLFPLQLEKVSDSDVGKWRLETAKAGLVRVYSVEGKDYVEILNFRQRMRAARSKYPAPDGTPPSSACGRVPPHADATETEAEAEAETIERERARARGPETVEEIVAAYPLQDSPFECRQAVQMALDTGEDAQRVLAAVKACAEHIRAAPGGTANRFVPKARNFFQREEWRSPEMFQKLNQPQTQHAYQPDHRPTSPAPCVNKPGRYS